MSPRADRRRPRTRARAVAVAVASMVAPGWQNKKKKTLKARDSKNAHALKVKRELKHVLVEKIEQVRGDLKGGK